MTRKPDPYKHLAPERVAAALAYYQEALLRGVRFRFQTNGALIPSPKRIMYRDPTFRAYRYELKAIVRHEAEELARAAKTNPEVARHVQQEADAKAKRHYEAEPTPVIRVHGIVVDLRDVKDALANLGDEMFDEFVAGTGLSKAKAYAIAARRLRQVLNMGGLPAMLRLARHEHPTNTRADSGVAWTPSHVATGGTLGTPTPKPTAASKPTPARVGAPPQRRTERGKHVRTGKDSLS